MSWGPLLTPVEDAPDRHRLWRVQGVEISAQKVAPGWRYQRGGVTARLDDVPDLFLTLGDDLAVARLSEPLLVPAGVSMSTWWAWPLTVVAVQSHTSRLDRFRPMMRRTVFGPIDEGLVLPGAWCGELMQPIAPPGFAALAVRITSLSSRPALLRRVPVDEANVGLFRRDSHLAVGVVDVQISDGRRAVATCSPRLVDSGWEPVRVTGRAPPGGEAPQVLDWLMDATRRSTGFDL